MGADRAQPLDRPRPGPGPEGKPGRLAGLDGIWKTRQIGPKTGPDDKPWDFEKPYMPHVATCRPQEAEVAPIKALPQNVTPISAARSLRDGKNSNRKRTP